MASHWMLPILLGISIVRGESCSDALYCMHHIDGVRSDLIKEDLASICSKTMKLVMCVEASIKDCRVKDIPIPDENMQQLSNSILQAKNMYNGYCQDVTSDPSADRETVERQPFQTVPADASCSDISECMMDMSALTDAVSNRRSHEACHRINPSVQCLQSAVMDCERNNQMSDEMLNNFKKSLNDSRAKLNQFCVDTVDESVYEAPPPVGHTGLASSLNIGINILIGLMTSLLVLWRVVV